jgi:hypothetical protein
MASNKPTLGKSSRRRVPHGKGEAALIDDQAASRIRLSRSYANTISALALLGVEGLRKTAGKH